MKHGIELNGVANIHMLLDNVVEEMCTVTSSQLKDLKEIENQLVLLERYMIAFNKAVNAGTAPPFWHEVKANPVKYPTNRES